LQVKVYNPITVRVLCVCVWADSSGTVPILILLFLL
jgi:hypothetical protein